MNERIRELAVEARNYALDEKRIYERVHNTEQCMEEYRDVYNKKFAELIVQECCDIVRQCRFAPDEDAIVNEIVHHFGVGK
jgi:hypothetical protein